MATMNISLPSAMKSWVERQAADGRYANACDYIRDLIRRDRERQEAIALLQAAITEGVQSGPAEPFDMAELKRALREKHGER
ncbi:antitoxin ParD4 [Allostella sp. ATCC 35155]|nr:antitoxin ParD4 [Stella sp. ATCC 35155]